MGSFRYCETAKQELTLYLLKSGEYGTVTEDEERVKLFEERMEHIYNDEKENWKMIVKKKQKEEEIPKNS